MPTTNHGQILRQHGDITGRRFLAQVAAKGDRTAAINRTINSLREDAIVTIPEVGGGDWACPKRLVELILAAAERDQR